MGRITISVYKAKPGKDDALLKLVHEHLPILKTQHLVTDRRPVVMRAADGSIVEIFEWASRKAIDEAHTNPEVQKLWGRFGEVCDFDIPVNVQEFHNMFSEFEPIN
jgi:hypothetical protein